MEAQKKQKIIVFSLAMAQFLLEKKEHLIKIEKNIEYPSKLVFLFEVTETIDKNMNMYLKLQGKAPNCAFSIKQK